MLVELLQNLKTAQLCHAVLSAFVSATKWVIPKIQTAVKSTILIKKKFATIMNSKIPFSAFIQLFLVLLAN